MPGSDRLAAPLLLLALTACGIQLAACGTSPERQTALSDRAFWTLVADLSEPAGAFELSDNLVSNETQVVHLIPMLRSRGGAYIGVGPEQNFTYIARLQPSIAFIVDIRRENRNLHLLYKALFELSSNRSDFLSRLFSREPPTGSSADTSVQELFTHYRNVKPSTELHRATIRATRDHLLATHGFPLSPEDLEWIEHVLNVFSAEGPDIHYWRAREGSPGPSYVELMTARDIFGFGRSYLATEETFALVKDLQARNLIVPIVGDFAGPDALRRVGESIRQQKQVVNTFYASNVEVYLNRQQRLVFCANLDSLPYDSRSWFINNRRVQRFPSKLRTCAPPAR